MRNLKLFLCFMLVLYFKTVYSLYCDDCPSLCCNVYSNCTTNDKCGLCNKDFCRYGCCAENNKCGLESECKNNNTETQRSVIIYSITLSAGFLLIAGMFYCKFFNKKRISVSNFNDNLENYPNQTEESSPNFINSNIGNIGNFRIHTARPASPDEKIPINSVVLIKPAGLEIYGLPNQTEPGEMGDTSMNRKTTMIF